MQQFDFAQRFVFEPCDVARFALFGAKPHQVVAVRHEAKKSSAVVAACFHSAAFLAIRSIASSDDLIAPAKHSWSQ
jgi:hypothetical protein